MPHRPALVPIGRLTSCSFRFVKKRVSRVGAIFFLQLPGIGDFDSLSPNSKLVTISCHEPVTAFVTFVMCSVAQLALLSISKHLCDNTPAKASQDATRDLRVLRHFYSALMQV